MTIIEGTQSIDPEYALCVPSSLLWRSILM